MVFYFLSHSPPIFFLNSQENSHFLGVSPAKKGFVRQRLEPSCTHGCWMFIGSKRSRCPEPSLGRQIIQVMTMTHWCPLNHHLLSCVYGFLWFYMPIFQAWKPWFPPSFPPYWTRARKALRLPLGASYHGHGREELTGWQVARALVEGGPAGKRRRCARWRTHLTMGRLWEDMGRYGKIWKPAHFWKTSSISIFLVIIHFYILDGIFPEIKHLFWGTPIYGNPHIGR